MLHAVLRRKARLDAAGEEPDPVSNDDFSSEVSRLLEAHTRIHLDRGNHL